MARQGKERREKFLTLPNTFDVTQKPMPEWAAYFGNNQPFVLELGAGHGTYTIALAKLQSEYNYIAIDVKSPRLLVGARNALSAGLVNAAFMRAPIERLTELFPAGSVAEIWLPFSDPYPKARHEKKRLTAPRFLAMYQRLLRPGGVVHLKTDDSGLYQFTLESVAAAGGVIQTSCTDIDLVADIDPRVLIQTPYEKTHRAAGKKILYVRFSL